MTGRDPNIARCTDFFIYELKDIYNPGCSSAAGVACTTTLVIEPTIFNDRSKVTYDWSIDPVQGVDDQGNHTSDTYRLEVTTDKPLDITVHLTATMDTGETSTKSETFHVEKRDV